ncbi:hypothetical protein ACS386_02525 [Flavobacteriaceae bacterium LMO-SS05]
MKTVKTLLTELLQIIKEIEANYPELYQYLDENPMTIPNVQHPKIGDEELEHYLESLRDLLDKRKNSMKQKTH